MTRTVTRSGAASGLKVVADQDAGSYQRRGGDGQWDHAADRDRDPHLETAPPWVQPRRA